jgi:alpha-1,6-mannosyltransferase
MKVVDITEFWSERGGGVRAYLTAKARNLVELGLVHRVLAPGAKYEEGRLIPDTDASLLVRYGGVPLPYDPSYRLLSGFRKAAKRVERERPDVLEIHSPELAALGALSVDRRAYGIRTFVWHSDIIESVIGEWFNRWAGAQSARWVERSLWRWVRVIASRCDATIAASASTAAKLRVRGIPRVVELPFGVDKRVFRPELHSDSVRRELLGSESGKLVVGVGRFAAEKNWPVVIRAIERLNASLPAKLVLIGDGPEREHLQRLASSRVKILGFERNREQLARLVASADALVHACSIETFCFAVAEAVAAGTPVVVPDVGAALERRAPSCSEMFRAGSASSLSTALERLFARDPSTLRARALEAAELARSEQRHFQELVELYASLGAGKVVERAA